MSNKTRPSAEYGSWVAYVRDEVMTWPNAVTSVRLVCAICMFKWPEGAFFVFWLSFIGTLSDAVDGFLAKHFGWGTRFGQRYDQYVDWLFGIALLHVLYLKEKVVWDEPPFNGVLLLLIGGYLLVRTFMPLVDTTKIAKWKTGSQFVGAVIILGGHASSMSSITTIGYIVIWSSIGMMLYTLVDYMRTARPT